MFRQDLLRGRTLESADGSHSRGFTRVGGHGCFLNHSLPLHTLPLEAPSLFPPLIHHRLVSRHSRVPGIIVVVIVGVVKTSNNGPNDRLFSSGDIDLPANRKPVKMNPLNRYTPTNFVTASRNATSINLPPSIRSRKRFARKGCTLELPTRNLINFEAIDSK